MKKKLGYGGAVVLACVLLLAAWNYLAIQRPLSQRLAQDERNEVVSIWGYHQYAVLPGILVLDLRSFGDEAALLDVMRSVLHGAEALKEKRFERVVLSYKGTPKFQLKGEYFRTLGQEFVSQNPVYTLRTFPENVYKLDGEQAYGTWTGGMLGVLSKQMEDLNRFGHDWYLDDEIKARTALAK